ncbi:unnamed protein product [Dibothriocephalus latus]|uniref:Uncharacterized protein n=1 Tax=Dibothriocephalus latus TaxID=60516 RepID=A0A3P7LDF3_DIBLA|nr:unnamed protein product [Dibothriocephalus latus]
MASLDPLCHSLGSLSTEWSQASVVAHPVRMLSTPSPVSVVWTSESKWTEQLPAFIPCKVPLSALCTRLCYVETVQFCAHRLLYVAHGMATNYAWRADRKCQHWVWIVLKGWAQDSAGERANTKDTALRNRKKCFYVPRNNYEVAIESIRHDLAEMKAKREQSLQMVTDLTAKLKSLEETKEEQRSEISSLRDRISEVVDQRDNLRQEFMETKKSLLECQREKEAVLETQKTVQSKLKEVQAENAEINRALQGLRQRCSGGCHFSFKQHISEMPTVFESISFFIYLLPVYRQSFNISLVFKK